VRGRITENLRLGNFSSLILMGLIWNFNRGFAIRCGGFSRLKDLGRQLVFGCDWFARAELSLNRTTDVSIVVTNS
jgi:hypothetical protein